VTRRIDKPDTPADRELRALLNDPEARGAVVIAGAGSGKTTSLIKALDHLEREHETALRRRRQKIACITYTNIAVDEIRTDLRDSPLVHAATINSFLWELVRPFQRDIAAWVAKRAEERRAGLIEERDGFSTRVRQKKRDSNAAAIARLDEAISTLGKIERYTYETSSDYVKGILGHDDVLRMVPELLRTKPLLANLTAQQYPYCFVDESQDTNPTVVEALKHVATARPGRFRLFFFGDPMQQIYTTGAGSIEAEDGWAHIEKPENYRSAPKILEVVNRIRARGDGLRQIRASAAILPNSAADEGTARLFVLPVDEQRTENLGKVRAWLARRGDETGWLEESEDADTRTLVIARRMAAARLGYGDLFSAFNDGTSDGVHDRFDEGTIWPLVPFVRDLVPMIEAADGGADFELISLLRDRCPRLTREAFQAEKHPAALLKSLKRDVAELVEIAADPQATARRMLRCVKESGLIRLDRRFGPFDLRADDPQNPQEAAADDESPIAKGPRLAPESIERFLDCPFEQIRRYCRYLTTQSPYSTQHGVKGAEFPRVLVVLDDAEGRHTHYSYDALFGQKEAKPSKTEGDTTIDRTLRLFYVCCSRAITDLAVVYYTVDPDRAHASVLSSGMFAKEDVYHLNDLL
jgi:DNA helicase-2/ATP-dependent DNA helicase PcrA